MVIDNSDIPVEIPRLEDSRLGITPLNSNVTGCIVTENELHFNVHIRIKLEYIQLV